MALTPGQGSDAVGFLHRIVVVVAAEDIETLARSPHRGDGAENIVAGLDSGATGVGGNFLLLRRRPFRHRHIELGYMARVAQMAPVEEAAGHYVVGVIGEIERSDRHRSVNALVLERRRRFEGIAE